MSAFTGGILTLVLMHSQPHLCRVQHLSLRYSGITDVGAEHIGSALGNFAQQNQKLLSLNLTGNKIGDAAASHIAKVTFVLKHIYDYYYDKE